LHKLGLCVISYSNLCSSWISWCLLCGRCVCTLSWGLNGFEKFLVCADAIVVVVVLAGSCTIR
jgi:hypothetical protein